MWSRFESVQSQAGDRGIEFTSDVQSHENLRTEPEKRNQLETYCTVSLHSDVYWSLRLGSMLWLHLRLTVEDDTVEPSGVAWVRRNHAIVSSASTSAAKEYLSGVLGLPSRRSTWKLALILCDGDPQFRVIA